MWREHPPHYRVEWGRVTPLKFVEREGPLTSRVEWERGWLYGAFQPALFQVRGRQLARDASRNQSASAVCRRVACRQAETRRGVAAWRGSVGAVQPAEGSAWLCLMARAWPVWPHASHSPTATGLAGSAVVAAPAAVGQNAAGCSTVLSTGRFSRVFESQPESEPAAPTVT